MSPAQTFGLHGDEWSIVLEQNGSAPPVWRHFGPRVDPTGLAPLGAFRGRATFAADVDISLPVLPTGDFGWFAAPAIVLRDEAGAHLPASFDHCDIALADDDLTLAFVDTLSGVGCTVRYRHAPGGGLTVSTALENLGAAPIMVDRCASATFPLPQRLRSVISWRGRHNAEFAECVEALPAQGWVRETRRGLTGHGGPHGCYLVERNGAFDDGLTVAFQLAWSGDARIAIEPTDEGFWTGLVEAVHRPGELRLLPGARHIAPDLLLAVSTRGRNGAVAQMHELVRERICWPQAEMRPRPVHLNSWEACYFAHDATRIVELAKSAAAIGVERFVLDDGWFRGRDNDRAGLGDWTADPVKYPQGLAPLAQEIAALGMEFGLWVEPEMVNPDSDLYRAHPDWVLALPDRARPTARNQLVLDLRRTEVRDHLFEALDTLLREVPIGYLKWDHNRDHAPGGGTRQVEGAYDLLARVRAAHPSVEIESCAGGGGRIDAGIAQFVHRFWASDNIDALSRVSIQRGFLAFMPPETMGAHVGASPSHATGRVQSLDFRAAIAMQGHFGVELDPARLPDADRATLTDWIALYKRWRAAIHGDVTSMGVGPDGLVWQAQGNPAEWLLWVVRRDPAQDKRPRPLLLPFAEGREWNVSLLRTAGQDGWPQVPPGTAFDAMQRQPCRFTGSWLNHAGLPLPPLAAQSVALFHLEACE